MRSTLVSACAIAALAPATLALDIGPNGLGFLSGTARTSAFGSAEIFNEDTQESEFADAFEENLQNVNRALNFTASSDTDGGLATLFPGLTGGSFGIATGSIASRAGSGLEIFVDVGAFGDSFFQQPASNSDGEFLVSGSFNADAQIDIIIQIPEQLEILGGNFGIFQPAFGGFDTGIYFFAPAGDNPGQVLEDLTLFPATGYALAPGTYALSAFTDSFSKSTDLSVAGWTMNLPLTTVLPSPGAAGLLALTGLYATRRRR